MDAALKSIPAFRRWALMARLNENYLDQRINRRAALMARIAACAVDGKVALVESGMDCDCVHYSGRVYIIDATLKAYHKQDDEIAEWADGPYSLEITRPDTKVNYESRDLALEAFEDGHRHVIYG